MEFDGAVAEIFVMESKELLSKMEEALLKMEQGEQSAELINSIFRSAHTLKGAAAMFDFKELTGFSHELESILTVYRSNNTTIQPGIITALLEAVDCLGLLLEESVKGKILEETLVKRKNIIAKLELNNKITPVNTLEVPKKEHVDPITPPFTPKTELHSEPLVVVSQPVKITEPEVVQPAAKLQPVNKTGSDVESAPPKLQPAATQSSSMDGVTHQDLTSSAVTIEKNFIKVDASKLDEIINLIGEVVIIQAHLTNLIRENKIATHQFVDTVERVSNLIDTLRSLSLQLRMLPIKEIFNKFNRIVRDVASKQNKQIRLQIEGAETELDKAIIEKINDPLLHLVRNACDHGIDLPTDRMNIGKSPCGTVTLSAQQENDEVVIKTTDDGKGIDLAKIKKKAVSLGLIKPEAELSEAELLSFIFYPGFSTAEQVTDLSGRGVGMDVVKKEVEKLHGSVYVNTKSMVGTTVSIRLPLTLAIIQGLLVKINDFPCVIPMWNVIECVQINHEEYQSILIHNHMKFRNKILPGVILGPLLGISTNNQENTAVIIKYADYNIAIVVDCLEGEIQAVIKPMPEMFSNLHWINGATILGDGQVAVILDVPGLISEVVAKHNKIIRIHYE